MKERQEEDYTNTRKEYPRYRQGDLARYGELEVLFPPSFHDFMIAEWILLRKLFLV